MSGVVASLKQAAERAADKLTFDAGRSASVKDARHRLRDAERAHSHEVHDAEDELRRARRAAHRGEADAQDVAAAERALAEVHGRHIELGEDHSLLSLVSDELGGQERIEDFAPAVRQGEGGVAVLTDRRVLFVGPRRRMNVARSAIEETTLRRGWPRRSLVLHTTEGDRTLGGLDRTHARELIEQLREG